MADVFISYKREQRPQVQRIARGLQELGLSVWFDANLEGGRSFHEQINREARAAGAMIVCWTPEAANSQWVIGEAEIGRARGVLVPVSLAATDIPAPFNALHSIEFGAWSGDHGDETWISIVQRIGTLTARTGLRHVALALAAGETVQTFGRNEADGPTQSRAASSRRASNPRPGNAVGALTNYLGECVLVALLGPFAFIPLRRRVLFVAMLVVCAAWSVAVASFHYLGYYDAVFPYWWGDWSFTSPAFSWLYVPIGWLWGHLICVASFVLVTVLDGMDR